MRPWWQDALIQTAGSLLTALVLLTGSIALGVLQAPPGIESVSAIASLMATGAALGALLGFAVAVGVGRASTVEVAAWVQYGAGGGGLCGVVAGVVGVLLR